MDQDLFSKPPKYTIDTSSLIDIFEDQSWASKRFAPGLWEGMLELIRDGVLISHAEVLDEIQCQGEKGVELYDWAHGNKAIFTEHDWEREGPMIRSMHPKYSAFVDNKIGSVHADPWLVAQARVRRLTIISEEQRNGPGSKTYMLPNVCDDPLFGVRCINLLAFAKEQGWRFRR